MKELESKGLRAWGWGFRVSGYWAWGLGFGAWTSGFRLRDAGLKVGGWASGLS